MAVRDSITRSRAKAAPTEAVSNALKVIERESDAALRSELLIDLGPKLEGEPKAVVHDVLAAIKSIDHDYLRATTYIKLANFLPKEERQSALKDAYLIIQRLATVENNNRPILLVQLGLAAPEAGGGLNEAFDAVKATPDPSLRAYLLIDLARVVPETERVAVLRDALTAANAVSDKESRDNAIGSLEVRWPNEYKDLLINETLSRGKNPPIIWAKRSSPPKPAS